MLAKFDYLLLRLLRPIGWLLAGRVLFGARIDKLTDSDGNRIDISIELDGEPASDLNPKNRIVDN